MRQLLPFTPSLQTTALALATTVLVACASQPPTTEAQPGGTEATPAAASSKSAPSSTAQGDQMAELRKALEGLGLAISDTPEGHLKISIPGDTSFGLGRTTVGPAFARLLNGIAEVFNKHPDTAIEIVGHTDTSGTDAINLAVSKKRADSTKDHLVGRKVAAERIKTQGWGSDQPVGDNNTAQGRAANRRVEIFVTGR